MLYSGLIQKQVNSPLETIRDQRDQNGLVLQPEPKTHTDYRRVKTIVLGPVLHTAYRTLFYNDTVSSLTDEQRRLDEDDR